MNTAFLKTRQTKFTAYAVTYIVVVLAILVAVNWLANRYNKSVDTTANKRFSLSDQTEKVVKGLQQNVTIAYYDRPSEFRTAKDLLDRYDALSAKLTVDYIDPDKKPQLARAAGVEQYRTVLVEAAGKREQAQSVTEEAVTGALIRVLKGGSRTVCSVAGSGEHSFDDSERTGYSAAKELIEKNNYKTRTISLLEKAEVPKDCTILLIAGPRLEYVDPAVEAIRKYVEGGGRALIMLDPPATIGKDTVRENVKLLAVLASWGVTANKDLVLDMSGIGQVFGLSEIVPLVRTYESHAIVRPMRRNATAFPLARSLDTGSGTNTTVEKLFSTTENSFASSSLGAAEIQINPEKDKKGPLTLGVAGTYKSGTTEGRFVVVGSSSWAANNIVGAPSLGNADLFLNMLNWLSSDEDLISIRPKDPEDRRLSLSRREMQLIFYSSVVGIPLLIIAAGFGVWWRRR